MRHLSSDVFRHAQGKLGMCDVRCSSLLHTGQNGPNHCLHCSYFVHHDAPSQICLSYQNTPAQERLPEERWTHPLLGGRCATQILWRWNRSITTSTSLFGSNVAFFSLIHVTIPAGFSHRFITFPLLLSGRK